MPRKSLKSCLTFSLWTLYLKKGLKSRCTCIYLYGALRKYNKFILWNIPITNGSLSQIVARHPCERTPPPLPIPPAKYLEFTIRIGVTFIRITVGKYKQGGGSPLARMRRWNRRTPGRFFVSAGGHSTNSITSPAYSGEILSMIASFPGRVQQHLCYGRGEILGMSVGHLGSRGQHGCPTPRRVPRR